MTPDGAAAVASIRQSGSATIRETSTASIATLKNVDSRHLCLNTLRRRFHLSNSKKYCMRGDCAFHPELNEHKCGCREEVCMECGAFVVLYMCDDHMREHFGE
jgi:hypothetical protein